MIKTRIHCFIHNVTTLAFQVHTHISVDELAIFVFTKMRVFGVTPNEFSVRQHDFEELGDARELKKHRAKRLSYSTAN